MPLDLNAIRARVTTEDEVALLAEVERLRVALAKGERLTDQLECLAVESHPSLYDSARAWREQVRKLLTLPSPS